MDAVKEAVLEQKIDDLSSQFERADQRNREYEERNREEHREMEERNRKENLELRAELRTELHAEIGGLRIEMSEGFRSMHERMDRYQQTLLVTMGTLVVAVIAALAAAATSIML